MKLKTVFNVLVEKQMQISLLQKSVEQLVISNHFHSLEAIRQMKRDVGHE